MKYSGLIFAFLSLFATALMAQDDKSTLVTLNNRDFTVGEFKQVYFKNLDLVKQQEERSLDEYLDLFIQYKRKVEAAKEQGLDQRQSYLTDFAKYQEQLSRNYVYEDNVTAQMVEQAYKRSKESLKTSHILILCNWDATPQDTLVAYNKAKELRQMVLNTPDNFNDIAAKYSEEPKADESRGSLDYFTVFEMVYPYESVAYNLKVGEISDLVRTQFGYHIVKLEDRRPVLPKRTVSHIMIGTRFDSLDTAKDRIMEISGLLEKGVAFEDLAKQYSDDKNTGINGGLMRPFTKGDLKAPPFEDAAFALTQKGQISAPVQTRFGWHIIRLEDMGKSPTFEDEEERLTKMVKLGDRAKIVTTAVSQKIKEELGFQAYPYKSSFMAVLNDSVFNRKWRFVPFENKENRLLFT
ncbi:MAG: peptidylprolyl isomerase, partial [Bacteroidetes bacterium]|nr:peptidylprolyl isomerase [Bacteroidota bacterium]